MDEKYTIISGTNRIKSNTYAVAKVYQELLNKKGINAHLLSMEGWKHLEKDPEFDKLEKSVLLPTQKFIFIAPEYNGSIPGVLKLMIDISDHQKVWNGKKALLTGISTGRSGNLRGLEHLTGILNYLNVVVYPDKLPISSVDKLLNGTGSIEDVSTLTAIDKQLDGFIQF